MKRLVTPVSVPVPTPPALSVAVIVKLPVLDIVTLWEARIPLVNVAVAPAPGGKGSRGTDVYRVTRPSKQNNRIVVGILGRHLNVESNSRRLCPDGSAALSLHQEVIQRTRINREGVLRFHSSCLWQYPWP